MAPKPTHQLLEEEWGKAIRNARGDRSQTWLAEQINRDQTTVSRIERGVYRLTPELMVDLAVALDAELDDLFRFPPGLASRAQFEQQSRALARAAKTAARNAEQVA